MTDGNTEEKEIIIVRRVHSGDHDDAHGGVWKVAFADFMTAMMAFFLVLWIVNSTSKETRSSVARYFNPIKLSNTTPARKGLQDPVDSTFEASKDSKKNERKIEKKTGADNDPQGKKSKSSKNTQKQKIDKKAEAGNKKSKTIDTAKVEKLSGITRISPKQKYAQKDANLKSLDHRNSGSRNKNGSGVPKLKEAYRDPFKLIKPKIVHVQGFEIEADKKVAKKKTERSRKSESSKATKISNLLKPKGETGRFKNGTNSASKKLAGPKGNKKLQAIASRQLQAEAIKKAIEIYANDKNTPRVTISQIPGGLLISMMDRANVSMFARNSAKLTRNARKIVGRVATSIKGKPGEVIIRGHTDATSYRNKRYNNWSLSAARAEKTLSLVLASGVAASRVRRIEGYADSMLKRKSAPRAPENRRIDIVIQYR